MKKNKWIIPALIIVIAAVVFCVIRFSSGSGFLAGEKHSGESEVASSIVTDTDVDASANGISIVSANSIAGMFVEDGSDEVLSSIFAVDFRNDSDKTLQYAKLTLVIDKEEYRFEISTLPAGETVRAMEYNRKEMPASLKKCELRCDNIAWFDTEPDMCQDKITIVERDGGFVVENISGKTISAPIHIYYKNYVDDIYVGGITYRATIDNDIEAGKTLTVPAAHFMTGNSKLMFVDYVS